MQKGVRANDTCADYNVCKIEYEYITAEIEQEKEQGLQN